MGVLGLVVNKTCPCASASGANPLGRTPTLFKRHRHRTPVEQIVHGPWDRAISCRGNVCIRSTASRREGETPLERRMRESAEVESRVKTIDSEDDFFQVLDDAGDKLVVLEVQSEQLCELGLDEPEPELHWKLDAERQHEQRMARCKEVKHVIQRTARESPDVVFAAFETDGTPERDALVRKLGVAVLPTLQFYKGGRLLWEHKGVMQMESGVGEGVMFYGDAAAGGVQPSSFVAEVTSRQQLEDFLAASADPSVLQVLNVALTSAGPCVRVFPAVVALSRSFKGFATFGRLLGDRDEETQALLRELNIIEVPTFIFFRAGKEVGRHVGSDRGDLIGQILQQQAAVGLSPPPPPVTAGRGSRQQRTRAGGRRKV